jgi:hypothetical protein
MKRFHVLAVVALLGAGATSAAAQQGVTLEFQDGKVRLNAQNASISQILSEWSRRGRTTIVNGERVPGPSVTLELQDVSEQQALEIVLRGVSGYLVAARDTAVAGASSYDRIYIIPTSSRPTGSAPAAPPQQALQVQDNLDDDDPPPGPRPPNVAPGANLAPGARLPRDVGPPAAAGRPPVPSLDDDGRNEPQNPAVPGPNNPFAPNTARPGAVTPGTPSPTPPGAITPAIPAPNTPGMITPAPPPNNRQNNNQ